MPRDRFTKQPIEVFGSEGNSLYTLGFLNFDLDVRPIKIAS